MVVIRKGCSNAFHWTAAVTGRLLAIFLRHFRQRSNSNNLSSWRKHRAIPPRTSHGMQICNSVIRQPIRAQSCLLGPHHHHGSSSSNNNNSSMHNHTLIRITNITNIRSNRRARMRPIIRVITRPGILLHNQLRQHLAPRLSPLDTNTITTTGMHMLVIQQQRRQAITTMDNIHSLSSR